ncbi:MAG: hypothetical protein ABI851_07330 [Saprospiraceae bacterium]
MKKLIFTLLTVFSFLITDSNAQGCVAVKAMGGLSMCGENSYNLDAKTLQAGVNYRYFHSWRHYVGKEEQPQRQNTGGGIGPDGKDHGNAVNIYSHAVDLNFSYGLTSRIQLNASIPYLNNERSQVLRQTKPTIDTFRYSVYASGLGDVRLSANYWIFNPSTAHNGNIMVGLGIKLPTGKFNVTDDNVPQSDGTTLNDVLMDQAIQPGDGGTGFSVELQGFKNLYHNIYGFANGYYLFNPRESTNTAKSAPTVVKGTDGTVLGTLNGYNKYACPDQFFARAGLMTSVLKSKNLNFSLAGRLEGIPAYDLIGGNEAYRRPGYVVSIEPGVSYRIGRSNFSLYIPKNVVRDRVQSSADIARQDLQNSVITDPAKLTHVQGDAAFADYSFSFSYSYRFGL